ncbi:MAG TPA: hypothetical protein VGN95_25000 [Pyrinomonadaceae bacterium]|nr:hypothetical protein [Pyrinomonadaceae bacterium]
MRSQKSRLPLQGTRSIFHLAFSRQSRAAVINLTYPVARPRLRSSRAEQFAIASDAWRAANKWRL